METTNSKMLKIFLWTAQALLAAMFLMSGFMKLTAGIDQLSTYLPWAKEISESLVRFIGLSELLGAFGLILPAITRIVPILTPIAAFGLTSIMLLAAFFHISRGEFKEIGINLTIALIALFVVWGRFKKVPIQSKKLFFILK